MAMAVTQKFEELIYVLMICIIQCTYYSLQYHHIDVFSYFISSACSARQLQLHTRPHLLVPSAFLVIFDIRLKPAIL